MLPANNHLNQESLKEWSNEHLEDYTRYLEVQMANLAIYYAQVRAEWDRRAKPLY
jgi:hypothetical protein